MVPLTKLRMNIRGLIEASGTDAPVVDEILVGVDALEAIEVGTGVNVGPSG